MSPVATYIAPRKGGSMAGFAHLGRATPYGQSASALYDVKSEMDGTAMCALHGKVRSSECLVDQDGALMCHPRHQCKNGNSSTTVGTSTPAASAYSAGYNAGLEAAAQLARSGGQGALGDQPQALKGGGSKGGAAMCSIHKKMRLVSAMRDNGWGIYSCIRGTDQECKISSSTTTTDVSTQLAAQLGPSLGGRAGMGTSSQAGFSGLAGGVAGIDPEATMICSHHGKTRSLANMEEDGLGGFKCAVGQECKIKADGPGAGGSSMTAVCALHDKTRHISALKDEHGIFTCTVGNECKVSNLSALGINTTVVTDPVTGQPLPLENGLLPNQTVVCTTHQKRRTASVMVDDGLGGFCCRPDMECKTQGAGPRGGGGQAICSMHGKIRSLMSMQDNGLGQYTCRFDQMCK